MSFRCTEPSYRDAAADCVSDARRSAPRSGSAATTAPRCAGDGETVHRQVSSAEEPLILVDEHDRPIGQASKRDCHAGRGLLHRAFSLLLFDDAGRLLLQRRAPAKPLWPGFWSNSCCSHPRVGEDITAAAHRRAREELGLTVELQYAYRFQYHARYLDLGSEHELCSVFLGRFAGAVRANANEVADLRFVAPEALDRIIEAEPSSYTPWFRMEWSRVRVDFPDLLAPR